MLLTLSTGETVDFDDYEGGTIVWDDTPLPPGTINEDNVCEWYEWLSRVDNGDRDYAAVEAYANHVDPMNGITLDTLDRFDEAYQGFFDTPGDFAEHFYNETGELSGDLVDYLDWDRVFWGELRYDFFEIDQRFYRNL